MLDYICVCEVRQKHEVEIKIEGFAEHYSYFPSTHSNVLWEALEDDAVDAHFGVEAPLGGSCCFCSSLGLDLWVHIQNKPYS